MKALTLEALQSRNLTVSADLYTSLFKSQFKSQLRAIFKSVAVHRRKILTVASLITGLAACTDYPVIADNALAMLGLCSVSLILMALSFREGGEV